MDRVTKLVEPWIRQFIKDRDLWVLRDKKTHIALNVSYSVDGLKWTSDEKGNMLWYKDAKLKHMKHPKGEGYMPYLDGDISASDKVYAEKFIPQDHSTGYKQRAEFQAIAKAQRMLYSHAS